MYLRASSFGGVTQSGKGPVVIVADTGQHNLQPSAKDWCAGPEVIDRREEILQTAQKLFPNKASAKRISMMLQGNWAFRRQAVYHYFTSKERDPLRTDGRAGQAVIQATERDVRQGSCPGRALAGVVAATFARYCRHRYLSYSVPELNKAKRRADAQMRAEQASYVRSIAKIITAGQKGGSSEKLTR